MKNRQPIGVFDSGLGGIHVLANLANALPSEGFVYFGDSANAPYGTRSMDEVRNLTVEAVTGMFHNHNIKALVIACNTATGAAYKELSKRFTFPIIGMQPSLQFAQNAREEGIILVMATPLALQSSSYQETYRQYGEKAVSLPCPGLMDFVEREDLNSPELDNYLVNLLSPYQNQRIDAVVLGCTHYPFLKPAIRKHVSKNAQFFDNIPWVVQQLKRKLDESDLLSDSIEAGKVSLFSSGNEENIKQMQRMFRIAQEMIEKS